MNLNFSTLDPEDEIAQKYPLVYQHSRNYAAKLIQKSWNRYMMRIVFKYLVQCAKEFEETLNPNELSRIFPEFLESYDPKMTSKLIIKMEGESFPPYLICGIATESVSSVDGGHHATKWTRLYSFENSGQVNRKALVYLFLKVSHSLKSESPSNSALHTSKSNSQKITISKETNQNEKQSN